MPRRDELYLADVVEACRDVGRFVADLSLDDWLTNDLVRYALAVAARQIQVSSWPRSVQAAMWSRTSPGTSTPRASRNTSNALASPSAWRWLK
jgi:hypothetical protein